MSAEALTIERCWTTQDGVTVGMCWRKSGITGVRHMITLALPVALEPGTRVLAQATGDSWRFVGDAISNASP